MISSDLMSWVPKLHQQVVSVGLHTARLSPHLVFWMYISTIATFLSIPIHSYEDLRSKNDFNLEDVTYFLLIFGVIFHLFVIRRQSTNMSVLNEFLLEPFRSYPPGSAQHRVIRSYYRKFAISWSLMGGNTVLCALSPCVASLVALVRLSEDVHLQDWPLPLGRVVLLWNNESVYWTWYLVSVSAMLTCLVIHSCWFGTFSCSTLLIATKLDLLVLEVESLDEQVRTTCKEELKHFPRLANYRLARHKVCLKMLKGYIRDVVSEHCRITEQVRLLDSTYRWIILVYIEITIVVSALIITISISEWKSGSNKGFLRLDLLFANLFFSFINNLCGQTIIDKFEKLRLSLYNVAWMDESLEFQRSLLIMLTVSNRPPRLSAGSIFKLSLVSFKRVVESMYSYISFLITIKRNEA